MEFRDKLVRLMDRRNMSQADLARALMTRSSTIQHWRDGRSHPDVHSLLKLARALGTPMEYLADNAIDDEPCPPDPEIQTIIGMVRDIGVEEARRRLLQVPPGRSAPAPASAEMDITHLARVVTHPKDGRGRRKPPA